MINPLEKLQQEHDKTKQALSEYTVITETNRLLAEKGQEDYEMLRSMGLHHNLQKVAEIKGKKIELEKLEQEYGNVFTRDEIKTIACRYALKFRRTDTYKGHVDPALMQKMREFSEQTGTELSPYNLQHRFYIMAPAKMFELRNEPGYVPPPSPATLPEPIVFYQIDENNYRMIHQWGKDLSNWRAVMGWKYADEANYFSYWFILMFIPLFILLNFFLSDLLWTFVPSAVVAAAVAIGRCIVVSDNADKEFRPWGKMWENEFKPKP